MISYNSSLSLSDGVLLLRGPVLLHVYWGGGTEDGGSLVEFRWPNVWLGS